MRELLLADVHHRWCSPEAASSCAASPTASPTPSPANIADLCPINTDPSIADPYPIDADPVDTDPIDADPIDTDPIDTDPIYAGTGARARAAAMHEIDCKTISSDGYVRVRSAQQVK